MNGKAPRRAGNFGSKMTTDEVMRVYAPLVEKQYEAVRAAAADHLKGGGDLMRELYDPTVNEFGEQITYQGDRAYEVFIREVFNKRGG